MDKELTKKLVDRFGKWIHPDYPPKTSLMVFGFDCYDGWFNLIWKLCEDIEKLNPPDDFEIVQVKQKFGTLRFYYSNAPDGVWELVSQAETDSETICETCGKEGTLRAGGWWETICDACVKNKEEENRKRIENYKKTGKFKYGKD